MIILLIGLPGAGKTALAKEICRRTDAIHLNADQVRSDLCKDLGFSIEDRVEQSRRMGAMARMLSFQGKLVIADFVNPMEITRKSFGKADVTVYVNRISRGRFEDTNAIWEDPNMFDVEILSGMSIEEEASKVLSFAKIYDWTQPTTLMLGRYQPWHEGHQALKEEAHKRTDQVLVGVRNTHETSEKDPLSYEEVVSYICRANEQDEPLIMKLPNITNIVYGRDVGYKIEHIELSKEIQEISATKKRKQMGI